MSWLRRASESQKISYVPTIQTDKKPSPKVQNIIQFQKRSRIWLEGMSERGTSLSQSVLWIRHRGGFLLSLIGITLKTFFPEMLHNRFCFLSIFAKDLHFVLSSKELCQAFWVVLKVLRKVQILGNSPKGEKKKEKYNCQIICPDFQ